MVLDSVLICYVDNVKLLGFMFTPDLKDDIDMLRQLRVTYAHSNTILRQFANCNASVICFFFVCFF